MTGDGALHDGFFCLFLFLYIFNNNNKQYWNVHSYTFLRYKIKNLIHFFFNVPSRIRYNIILYDHNNVLQPGCATSCSDKLMLTRDLNRTYWRQRRRTHRFRKRSETSLMHVCRLRRHERDDGGGSVNATPTKLGSSTLIGPAARTPIVGAAPVHLL